MDPGEPIWNSFKVYRLSPSLMAENGMVRSICCALPGAGYEERPGDRRRGRGLQV